MGKVSFVGSNDFSPQQQFFPSAKVESEERVELYSRFELVYMVTLFFWRQGLMYPRLAWNLLSSQG